MPDAELTELTGIEIDRVDGVKNPANGFPILLMKAIDPAANPGCGCCGNCAMNTAKDEQEPDVPDEAAKETEAVEPEAVPAETETPEGDAVKDEPETPTPDEDVEKNARAAGEVITEAVAKAIEPYEAALKELRDELAKVKATPIPGGPAVTAPAGARADSQRAELLKEAAYCDSMADLTAEQDMKVHYRAKAAAARTAAGV